MERPDREHTLDRLLGREAEVGCDECFDLLDRYVDLELAGADADAAVPGLRCTPGRLPCLREEHESLRALAGGDQIP